MDISKHEITNVDQISVGDAVIVVDGYRGRTTRVQRAEVTRKLKTKFELTFDGGRKVEYSSRIVFGNIKRYRLGSDYGSSTENMYPVNDEVTQWCAQENRKVKATSLRVQLGALAHKNRNDEAGTEEALNTAREIAHMAQRLVELEEEISKVDHEFAAREEQKQQ